MRVQVSMEMPLEVGMRRQVGMKIKEEAGFRCRCDGDAGAGVMRVQVHL